MKKYCLILSLLILQPCFGMLRYRQSLRTACALKTGYSTTNSSHASPLRNLTIAPAYSSQSKVDTHADFLNIKFLTTVNPTAQVLNAKSPLAWLIDEKKAILKDADESIRQFIKFRPEEIPFDLKDEWNCLVQKETEYVENQRKPASKLPPDLPKYLDKFNKEPKNVLYKEPFELPKNLSSPFGDDIPTLCFSILRHSPNYEIATGKYIYYTTPYPSHVDSFEIFSDLHHIDSGDELNLAYLINTMNTRRNALSDLATLFRLVQFYRIRKDTLIAWKDQDFAKDLCMHARRHFNFNFFPEKLGDLAFYGRDDLESLLTTNDEKTELRGLVRLLLGLKIHDLHQNEPEFMASEWEEYQRHMEMDKEC